MSDAAGERLESAKTALLAAACEQAQGISAQVIDDYWRFAAAEDVVDRGVEDLVAVVDRHRQLGLRREPEQALVSVQASGARGSSQLVVDIVTDDMPFLVDSVGAALLQHGCSPTVVVHPQFQVLRDSSGELTDVADNGIAESWMHFECSTSVDLDAPRVTALETALREVLDDVRAAVTDWPAMRLRAFSLADELQAAGDSAEKVQAAKFLRWLADDHFTFLGYREYDLVREGVEDFLRPRIPTGLGVLRDAVGATATKLTAAASSAARDPQLLVLTKANSRATVHRSAYLDYIGIKQFNTDGTVAGELRFLGLFTSTAYVQPVQEVPVVADKVESVMAGFGFSPDSHSGKDLLEFMETYPRDELFQIDSEQLAQTAQAVLQMAGRRVTRVFLRPDRYGRFVSALIYLPRDRFNSTARVAIEQTLREAFDAFSVDTASRVGEQMHARLHVVARSHQAVALTDELIVRVRERIAAAARSWDDDFADAVFDEIGDRDGARLLRDWSGGFSEGYRAEHTPHEAVAAVLHAQSLTASSHDSLVTLRPQPTGRSSAFLFTLYTTQSRVLLSAVMPLLQNLGVEVVDERPHEFRPQSGPSVRVYEFGLDVPADVPHLESLPQRFEEAFLLAWRGHSQNFFLDAAVTLLGLRSRDATILRSYARYLRQTHVNFSMRYLEETVLGHPDIAREYLELFTAKFDPDVNGDRRQLTESINQRIETQLAEVSGLDADRILRGFQRAINATVRTNAFMRGESGEIRPYLSFKIESQVLGDVIPSPRPFAEIWVCSPRVEGVHLRFGRVARGGLRWSDRRDDVRTEVLGLVKAQMVKNTVIVPVGAKGGFVVQNPVAGADAAARLEQGIACYREFVSGLLDVTDNIVESEVVAPARVVRWDADDPYLVVAADKGTATFSDIANSVSSAYGFWLGDAFASGGSAGYDHKAMGITAKGAWESVKRHFREFGVDTQSCDFTVVGVGDMSGDVFGNGMLCSPHIRLVAAFDHRHIFLDPNPDAARSFAERTRMFALARSSWADYDASLISDGGGVFARDSKSIAISSQVRTSLGLPESVTSLTPHELMRAILTAPVDLLWNGGIGTYVKARQESHSDVGDKANDTIRVDGSELKCRVVGEGGNLGFTQLGRVEAAQSGVHLNTDAIDNSAGVDTSDHEVNIKIFYDPLVRSGRLSLQDRDNELVQMTDDVARDVLRDNYLQNVVLGNARAQAAELVGVHRRFIDELERTGHLVRDLEFLPSDAALEAREAQGVGLTSPELAVLLAYAKLHLNDALTAAGTARTPGLADRVLDYFPDLLRQRYEADLVKHPLRDELVTTMLVNDLVNRAGISFAFRTHEETAADYSTIALAYTAASKVFDLPSIWARIESLDGQVSTQAQVALYLEARRLVDRATRWFIVTRGTNPDSIVNTDRLRDVVRGLAGSVPEMLQGTERARLMRRVADHTAVGVPEDLALDVAALLDVFSLLDVAELAERVGVEPADAAVVYFTVSENYQIDRLLVGITNLPRGDRWNSLARAAMRADVYATLAALTARVLRSTGTAEAQQRVADWESRHSSAVRAAKETLAEAAAQDHHDLATLSVAVRAIRSLLARVDAR